MQGKSPQGKRYSDRVRSTLVSNVFFSTALIVKAVPFSHATFEDEGAFHGFWTAFADFTVA